MRFPAKKVFLGVSGLVLLAAVLVIGRSWQMRQFGRNDKTLTVAHEGLDRKYKLHLPGDYAGQKAPLVIYLHGGGGDMRAAFMDGLDKMSDKYGFILAVPEALGEIKKGYLRGHWNGGKWETGECCGKADDIGFISKMIMDIKSAYPIDGKRIYASGISNGGLMANRLGCELAGQIAAIAPVAPPAIMSGCAPSRPVSVMEIYGMQDPAIPPDGSAPRSIFAKDSGTSFAMSYDRMTPSEVIAAWKGADRCSDQKAAGYRHGGASCEIYNDCAGGAEVELCLVEGMGHTYPAGFQYLPERMVGPVSYDISFDQIWEFFQSHPMP